ncbi:unnamed protein product [Trichogramma brassicae]|uniref:Uncharacterized protein n=1 Tax=Trichogramma brassicae TaxID=86971 RepID=A0A6H5IEJ9_9HYME|nr:unnamed protein product [Trichogramma brassicae]
MKRRYCSEGDDTYKFNTYEIKKFIELRDRLRNNWENESERYDVLDPLYHLIINWRAQFPNFQKYFLKAEIDWLLIESVRSINRCPENSSLPERFIDFVVRSGYRDVPELDQDNEPVVSRTTAVHHAGECNYEVVGNLFSIYDRFDVNYTDETGFTHFHAVCQFDDILYAKKFLELGQDVNCVVSKTGDSPLLLALAHGCEALVQFLLRRGADTNLANAEGSSPLHVLCNGARDDEFMAKKLLHYTCPRFLPVNVNAQDSSGNTPLHLALRRGKVRLVEWLLNNGADTSLIHAEGSTPVPSWDVRDKSGNPLLHLALEHNFRVTTEFLLRGGANPNSANRDGLTPLHIICQRPNDRLKLMLHRPYGYELHDDSLEVFFKICDDVKQTVRVNAQDKYGNTPLHLLLRHNKKKMAGFLHRRGADLNLANKDGSTPLQIIYQRFFDDIIEVFFEIRTFAWLTEQPLTTQQLDLKNRLPDVICSLLDHGSDLSGFVLPDASNSRLDYDLELYASKRLMEVPSRFYTLAKSHNDTLRKASGALAVFQNLEEKGFEWDRSNVLRIMKFLSKYQFSKKSMEEGLRGLGFEECAKNIKILPRLSLYNSRENDNVDDDSDDDDKDEKEREEEARQAKGVSKAPPSLSLYDLIQLRPEEAARQLTYTDYLELANTKKLLRLPEPSDTVACVMHLYQKLSWGFFRRWVLDSFLELIHYRLPVECLASSCRVHVYMYRRLLLIDVCACAARRKTHRRSAEHTQTQGPGLMHARYTIYAHIHREHGRHRAEICV